MQHHQQFDRHDRVKSLLTSLAASFIRNEANPNPLITVTNIDISSDYKRTTVFVTTIPNEGENDALIFLKRKAGEFRTYIKKNSDLKFIPHVDFEIDRGERHRQHIDEITRNIDTKD